MKRIFIGVKIQPDEIFHSMLSSLKSGLKDDNIKWTDPANMHITLAFIGNTEEDKIAGISTMLEENCKGSGRFEIIIKGVGLFKNSRDPRILFTATEPSEKLQSLHDIIFPGLRELGIKLEDRPFKPHITLGRIKNIINPGVLSDLIANYQNAEIQRIQVKEIILFESILFQTGPVYNKMSLIDL